MKETNTPTPGETPADDYDSPRKEVLGHFFPAFVQFFMPDLYEDIDWNAGYEFLEQELREMLRDAETGPRRVDKVVKVRLVNWEPKRYKNTHYRTHLMFCYRTVKLWKYNGRWSELENDPNPMALVVMAHLKTKTTRDNGVERLSWKIEFVRQLYARGYRREDIHELFRFIDWILALPPEIAKSFREQVEQIDQESKMKYVTSIERLYLEEGREEGREEGFLKGMQSALLTQYEEKFGPPDSSIQRLVKKANREQVLTWMKRILTATSPDEVMAT